MKKIFLMISLVAATPYCQAQPPATRIVCINGGDFVEPFIRKVIALTKKENPKICFLPTASAENPYVISGWYEMCRDLPMKPYILHLFINSAPNQRSFEEILMGMDAIVVGGGSTLNMIAIWRAQGLDTVLRKAYAKGIVMAGGSAGSLCWFTAGLSDSRPKTLSVVDCLGFIPASHCPHYHSNASRQPMYQDAVLSGKLQAGYACDDHAGMLFENEKYVRSFAVDTANHTYFVSVEAGKINERMLPVTEIIK